MKIIDFFKTLFLKKNISSLPNDSFYMQDTFYYFLHEGYTSFLRFYLDRTVLYFGVRGDQMQHLEEIAGWFNKDFGHEFLGKGTYISDGRKLEFDIKSNRGVVAYNGTIEDDNTLLLSSHSFINGNKSQERYTPLIKTFVFDWANKSPVKEAYIVTHSPSFDINISTTKQLEQLIGKENLTEFYLESLEGNSTSSFLNLINNFLNVSKNELKDTLATTTTDYRVFSISANGKTHELKTDNYFNYVASTEYLKFFNSILELNGSRKRFFYYWDDYDFEHVHGYFFSDKEFGIELINFLKNPPDLHPKEFLDTGGNRIIRMEFEDSDTKLDVEYVKQLIQDR